MQKFLAEKKKLIDSVMRNGRIVYNADDETACRLVRESPLRKISCGLSGDCEVRGTKFEILSSNAGGISKPTGMWFEITTREHSPSVGGTPQPLSVGSSSTVTLLDTIGIHNEYATLLSVAVVSLLGISTEEVVKAIEKLAPLAGRMKIISGIKDSTVLDDSYNSSPIAARMAVEALARVQTSGRKIAVIGDMLELGKFSAEEHRELGRLLAPVAQYAVCVGLRTRRVAEMMLSLSFDENNISCFDTSAEAGNFLQNFIQPGDLILVKGSQAMRLEKMVEQIMRHPEDARTLLVRQEPEWLERK
jgi:UDP-N-acetylmuramoyl-tripeptide--D-alanyl-D-alanine ligase